MAKINLPAARLEEYAREGHDANWKCTELQGDIELLQMLNEGDVTGIDIKNAKLIYTKGDGSTNTINIPLATALSSGFLSMEDWRRFDALSDDMLASLQGTSPQSSAYTDPFRDMGYYNNFDEFNDAVDNIGNSTDSGVEMKYVGHTRWEINGMKIDIYTAVGSWVTRTYVQFVQGIIKTDATGRLIGDSFPNIYMRSRCEDSWSAWSPVDGVVNMGVVDTMAVAENYTSLVMFAANDKLRECRFKIGTGINKSHIGVIYQYVVDDTSLQRMFMGGHQWHRYIYFTDATRRRISSVGQWFIDSIQ